MISPHTIRGALLLVAVLLALGGSRVALAQTAPQKQEAKDHYDKARRFYDLGRYDDAIEEYQKVYLLIDDAGMLYNIGQAYRLSDRPEEALRFYRNFLRRSPAAPNRADVERKIADQEKLLEQRRSGKPSVTAPPPEPAPAPLPATPVTAGPPPVTTATAPPPPPPEVTTAPPPVVATSAPLPVAPPPSSRGGRVGGWILVVSGGALLATAAVSGLIAASKSKDLENRSKRGDVFVPSVESTGKTTNTLAIVTGIAGVAAVGVGGVLLFLSHGAPPESAAGPARLALFPWAGPQGAGAGARVSF